MYIIKLFWNISVSPLPKQFQNNMITSNAYIEVPLEKLMPSVTTNTLSETNNSENQIVTWVLHNKVWTTYFRWEMLSYSFNY